MREKKPTVPGCDILNITQIVIHFKRVLLKCR